MAQKWQPNSEHAENRAAHALIGGCAVGPEHLPGAALLLEKQGISFVATTFREAGLISCVFR